MAEATTVRVRTTGMHCQSCAMLVKMNLEDVEGVRSADVDVPSGVSEVTYDPEVATVAEIVAAIKAAGYGASTDE